MRRKKIAVIFGGCSAEYNVSLESAAGVLKYWDHERYEAVLVGITRDGRWFSYQGPAEKIACGTWTEEEACVPAVISPDRGVHGLLEWTEDGMIPIRIDAAFPVLHGRNGEDGTIQGLLRLAGIPVIGCGVLASAVCMDKDVTHRLAAHAGIMVPSYAVLWKGMDRDEIWDLLDGLTYPLYIKPARAGSSIGITKILSGEGLWEAANRAWQEDEKAVAEQEVDGFEVGCAVLGRGKTPFIGEVDEVELRHDFLDYEEKYGERSSVLHVPARLAPRTAGKIRKTAAKLYCALGLGGFARIDMFLTPAGEVVLNEVNTIPGLTAHSRYPQMLRAAGMDFQQMLNRLIEEALQEGEGVCV